MKLSASPNVTNGNSTILVTLTKTNSGVDTSTLGSIPKSVINFSTNLGTIISPVNTLNGIATTTFNRATTTLGTATINSTFDKQTLTTTITINGTIININTNKIYSSIQSAIDDISTLNGNIIQLMPGIYNENVIVNKTLTFMPVSGGNVTIKALNPSNPVFTINILGSGTKIQGFTIIGATNSNSIYLNGTTSCNIIGNNFLNNTNTVQNNNINFGVFLNNSYSTTIQNNTFTDNYGGIRLLNSNNNSILNNIISNTVSTNHIYGICLTNSKNILITGNSITKCFYGINPQQASTATIQFNRIYGCGAWGLIVQDPGTSVIATNNWWGSNNPPKITTTNQTSCDICIQNSATVTYNPWLVLKVTTSHPSGGKYEITADLTHNSNGDDTSPLGNIPDTLPVNFSTNFGTIGNIANTKKGKSISNLNITSQGSANIAASFDNMTVSKTIYLGSVYDISSQKGFSSIQAAIDDVSTLSGDVIQIDNGTYTENITINKKLNILSTSGENPLIKGTITINSGGNGSLIQGLRINGYINLNANNCTIYKNIINVNGTAGIISSNTFNNTIAYNTINCNCFDGIHTNSSTNTIYNNIISGGINGIYSGYGHDNITSNYLYNNTYGIWTYNSTDNIHFNKITGNVYGLRNELGTVNATNNWWGSNADPISKINNVSGTVISNPWLILSVNASSTNSGGNTSVTADLTHNIQGTDTQSQGFVPDGTPVNFTTNTGTIVNPAYTIKGQAETILHLNTLDNITVNVSATADNQTVTTSRVISTGNAVLNITSTAIDNSTSLPLNITYTLPLNNSVTWLSILWKPTTIPKADELQIILNGTVVMKRYIYQNTSQDTLTFYLSYPGVTGKNITVFDPKNNNTIELNFPGNFVNRTSQLTYNGTPYEGVRSFAIATTEVTPDILNYWLNQSTLYQDGAWDAPYATFLTALMVEYEQDQIADNITGQCNVTWNRTNPIIVSVVDSPYETYLTLECDHCMGMTVVGTPENIRLFNYITSSSISPVEYAIMNGASGLDYQSYSLNGRFESVSTELINEYLTNSTSVESFMQDGYIIEKSVGHDDNFIVIDPETGIVRDINLINNICGVQVPHPPAYDTMLCNPHILPASYEPVVIEASIYWDGYGKYVVGSTMDGNALSTNQIWTIGDLTFTTAKGTVRFKPNGTSTVGAYNVFVGAPVDITSILNPGTNTVLITIYPIGSCLGCSTLYGFNDLYNNTGYHGINTTDVYNLGQIIKNNPILPSGLDDIKNDGALQLIHDYFGSADFSHSAFKIAMKSLFKNDSTVGRGIQTIITIEKHILDIIKDLK